MSRTFNDVYYDADGPREAARVFLAPAEFAERTRDPAHTFTVGELGFGTGLNFILAAQTARCRLHFISFERHPLSPGDLSRALAPWQTEFPLVRSLIENYPAPILGWHRRLFDDSRVRLSVYFGDVRDGLEDLEQQQRRGVDAWFLDGFAPRRNAAMWRRELFDLMARLSARQASVTTFTAAGQVRRDLAAAGFDVRRVDQRPHKRHSTAGTFTGNGSRFVPPIRATVRGAGLAGTATARSLANRGISTTLLDPAGGIARGTSAIPAAVLHPRLSPLASTQAGFRLHAYAYAACRCRGLAGVSACGVLQLPGPTTDAERLRRIGTAAPVGISEYLDPVDASDRAGIVLREPGLFFPQGLTVCGRLLAEAFSDHPDIEVVASLDSGDSTQVRATGANVDGCPTLEVTGLAGQIDRFACESPPRLPIMGNGACVPTGDGVWLGATYEYRPWASERATAANADRFLRLLGKPPAASLQRFRGVRGVTSDRLPVIGQDNGVWFNLGHGSHGTTTAILGAEIVASAIAGEVAPVTADILNLLRPGRFRERQKRRPNPFATSTDD